MTAGSRIGAALGRVKRDVAGRLRDEAGFTLIEVVLAAMMLAIISAPISAIISQSAVIAKLARERTGADQIAQTQIESIRALDYYSVGTSCTLNPPPCGNPSGSLFATSPNTTFPNPVLLPDGEAVTIKRQVTYVADPIPTAFVTNADYKKVVVTVSRASDGHQLSQKTTYVSSASAPPYGGSTWVQIKRQVIDAVTNLPLAGVSVNLTGGPKAENRTDVTDGAGNVVFPALTSSSTSLPVFTLVSTLSGYAVFPDDISPGAPSSIPSTPGLISTGTIRMYLPTTLTVNVQSNGGGVFNSGAYVSLDSSRCGVQQATIPAGSSSITFTTCDYANGKTVPLVPNVLGQVPLDDKYYVTAWAKNGTGNWSPGTAVTVPSAYPTTLSQTVNVQFVGATYATTKGILVTVKKAGAADANARVEVTGTPTGLGTPLYLYGTTNSSGQVTITVPVVSTSTTFTVNANDMGVTKGSGTVSLSTASGTTTSLTVNIS